MLWTNKRGLKKWVEGFGTSLPELLRLANGLRNSWNMGFTETRTRFPHGAFWLTLSPSCDEQPVNLVVPRESLEKLPGTRRWRVSDDGKERLA